MTLEDLMQELDIESPEDFMYFEQFSALMEYDGELDDELFAEILELASPENLAEMTEDFFEDLVGGIPDDNVDFYSAINTEKDLLHALAGASGKTRERALYVDELYRFREWYLLRNEAICRCIKTDIELTTSIYDALVLYRLEKMSGDKYDYDFSALLPYEPDEYAFEVASDLSAFSDNDYDYDANSDNDYDIMSDDYYSDNSCGCGHHHHHHGYDDNDEDSFIDYLDPDREIDPFTEGLVDRDNPVIDGVDYGD